MNHSKDNDNHDGKEYVSMVHCQLCNEGMYILLKKNLKKTLPPKIMIPGEVCKDCTEKYLKKGILLFNPNTPACVVITDDAFRRMVTSEEIIEQAVKLRKCGMEESILMNLIHEHNELKRGEPSGTEDKTPDNVQ